MTALIHCPICDTGGRDEQEIEGRSQPELDTPIKIVTYRSNGVRLECPRCHLRFTVPLTGEYGLIKRLRHLDVVEVPLRPKDVLRAFPSRVAVAMEMEGDLYENEKQALILHQIADELEEAEKQARAARS